MTKKKTARHADTKNTGHEKRAPKLDLRDHLPAAAAGLAPGSYTARATNVVEITRNDDEVEQLDDVCRELEIGIRTKIGARKPPVDSTWKPAQSWTCLLSRLADPTDPSSDRELIADLYGGAAVRNVSAADVLMSLCIDARATELTFEEWCAETDANSDSRAAERMYKACVETGTQVRAFLGEHFERCARAEH